MNQNQPNEFSPKKAVDRTIQLLWAALSVIPVTFFILAIKNEITAKSAGDSPLGFYVFFVLIPCWIASGFLVFFLTKQKIGAWIFGILLFASIGFYIYTIVNTIAITTK